MHIWVSARVVMAGVTVHAEGLRQRADGGAGYAPAVTADDLSLVTVLNRLFSDVTEATRALVAVLIDVEVQQ